VPAADPRNDPRVRCVGGVGEPELAEGLGVHVVKRRELGDGFPTWQALDVPHAPREADGELLVQQPRDPRE